MESPQFDVVVIGSGPAGYVCAIRAAQLGLSVACVERDASLGGTCLNVGCIPSKALLESSERYASTLHELETHGVHVEGVSLDLAKMMERKTGIVGQLTGGIKALFQKNKVELFQGTGTLRGDGVVGIVSSEGESAIRADAIVIATGSEPTDLRGVECDGDRIVTSTEALSFDEVPEHLVVVGAGVIGLELGSVWSRLGSKVTVLEYLDRILPGMDNQIAKESKKILGGQGLEFICGAAVRSATPEANGVKVAWDAAHEGSEAGELICDRVLVAIGRRAFTFGLGCDAVGVARDERGRIIVDESWETNVPGVFAIGDVIAGPMLAHKASDEGVALAELLAGQEGHLNYDAIPSVVYTHPEIAGVGKTEEQLKSEGTPYKRGSFRYAANGRALGIGETQGIVKMLAHKDSDRLLGCHIVGAHAGDLIAEIALAIEFGASSEDIARTVHAHPTLAEIVKEAALDVDKRALHR